MPKIAEICKIKSVKQDILLLYDILKIFNTVKMINAIPFIHCLLISEKIVLPLRPKETPVYYHRKFARVPTIDECELEDTICKFEASEQLIRDRYIHFTYSTVQRHVWVFIRCNKDKFVVHVVISWKPLILRSWYRLSYTNQILKCFIHHV